MPTETIIEELGNDFDMALTRTLNLIKILASRA